MPDAEPRLDAGELYVLDEEPLKGDPGREPEAELEPEFVPQIAQEKESDRPLYPLAKVCVVFERAALPLHVGHDAEGKRVEPNDPTEDEPIDKNDIYCPP